MFSEKALNGSSLIMKCEELLSKRGTAEEKHNAERNTVSEKSIIIFGTTKRSPKIIIALGIKMVHKMFCTTVYSNIVEEK